MTNKRKKWRNNNYEKAKSSSKEHFQQNKKEIIETRKIRRHIYSRRQVHHILKNRIYSALKSNVKTSSTKDLLGIITGICRKRVEIQMTPEMNWNNIHIDQVRPTSSIDVSKEEELKEVFNWRNI